MVCGQPKWYIQPESRARVTVAAVSGWGKVAEQRVKRSSAVRQYRNPAEEGRGPTRSMRICRKREGGRGKSQNVVTVGRETLERWQSWQPRAQMQNSSWMACHTKSWERRRCLNFRVAEGMLRVEYLTAQRRWVVWAWFSSRCIAVQLGWGAGNEKLLELYGCVTYQ